MNATTIHDMMLKIVSLLILFFLFMFHRENKNTRHGDPHHDIEYEYVFYVDL